VPNPMSGIYKRLAEVGFDRKFVKDHVLPDWWDDELASNAPSRLIAECDIARHLGLSLEQLDQPSIALSPKPVRDFRLKHSKGVTPADMLPAVVVAQRAAKLVLEIAKPLPPFSAMLSALEVRSRILRSSSRIDLESIVAFCWDQGIAILHLAPEHLPAKSKKFHGMTFFPDSHPVIVLAFGSDSPPWLAFHALHELGHLFEKHVEAGGLCLVDSEIDEVNDDPQEQAASVFAVELLTGDRAFDLPPCGDKLGRIVCSMEELGRTLKVDPGSMALFFGRSSGNWKLAQMILARLREKEGAQRTIADALVAHLDLEDIPDYVERFLSCLSAQVVKTA